MRLYSKKKEVSILDVMQAIRDRRSIRKYRSEPVTEEALHTILEAVRRAPSWTNTQCWRLIVVRDSVMKKKLADLLRTGRPDGKNAATEAVRNAPVVVVACAERGLSGFWSGDRKGMPATDKGEWWFMFDLALAMQNLTLAAHALGLGTVHVGLFDVDEVARILGVPENIAVVELMALGWPDEKPSIRPRKDISEFVFYERYSS
jgi:nitroreductase